MEMKKLLNIMSEKTKLTESNESCGLPAPAAAGTAPQSPPVSMTVNMNASGVDQIKQLLGLIGAAQATPAEPPQPVEMPAMLSMQPKLSAEEFANDDDSEVMDLDAIIRNGDDLHKQKGAYKAAQPGDNAMAVEHIKTDLKNLYKQIKES